MTNNKKTVQDSIRHRGIAGMAVLAAILFFATVLVLPSAQASDTLFDNTHNSDNPPCCGWIVGQYPGSNNVWLLIYAFTPSQSDKLDSVGFLQQASSDNPPTDGFSAFLYADNGGAPGAVMESWQGITATQDIQLATAKSVLHPALTAGKQYWFGVTTTNPTQTGNWITNPAGLYLTSCDYLNGQPNDCGGLQVGGGFRILGMGGGATFTVLHSFTGGQDGARPIAGVTLDRAGNVYGTTAGGAEGYGTTYQLKRKGSGWTFNLLYAFNGSAGANPYAGVAFGANGSLYGTTYNGGAHGAGTVFNLRPPIAICKAIQCLWTETVLYSFTGGTDGNHPLFGNLLFDLAGNIYGTSLGGSFIGCSLGCGVVYELTPTGSGYMETPIYSFSGSDGRGPENSLIVDGVGKLYGTTSGGGSYGGGTTFELIPAGGGWTGKVLYNFQNGGDGESSWGSLVPDQSGNLYGTTSDGGMNGGGTVFELSPSNGSWTLKTLYSFSGTQGQFCGPRSGLVMDGTGNLYGATLCDGANGWGNVFELSPSGGSWAYTSLYDFTVGDGAQPFGKVALDASGNLYGTASEGGSHGNGVVWQITP